MVDVAGGHGREQLDETDCWEPWASNQRRLGGVCVAIG